MLTLKIKESMKIFQLTILLVGILLAMSIFCIDRSISSQFKSSMLTLKPLLIQNTNSKGGENI